MLIDDLHIADSYQRWTLFGPYAQDRVVDGGINRPNPRCRVSR